VKYMLDTNIVIYLIKNNPSRVRSVFVKHKVDDVCISSITLAELLYGVEKSQAKEKNKLAVLSMLTAIRVLDFTSQAAEQYGILRAGLERKGKLIGPMDMLIAGHALSEHLILVTNNEKEFQRVAGLKVENWVK